MNNAIGIINKQEIQTVIVDKVEYIYLKPICSALGISYSKEVHEVMDNDFVSDKHKLLPFVVGEKETDSIAIPLKYMLGYVGVISRDTVLNKVEYIENLKVLHDLIYNSIFKQ